jgi:hypothetical protein
MSFQQLETRLSRIAAKTPEKVNPEAEAAFKAITRKKCYWANPGCRNSLRLIMRFYFF